MSPETFNSVVYSDYKSGLGAELKAELKTVLLFEENHIPAKEEKKYHGYNGEMKDSIQVLMDNDQVFTDFLSSELTKAGISDEHSLRKNIDTLAHNLERTSADKPTVNLDQIQKRYLIYFNKSDVSDELKTLITPNIAKYTLSNLTQITSALYSEKNTQIKAMKVESNVLSKELAQRSKQFARVDRGAFEDMTALSKRRMDQLANQLESSVPRDLFQKVRDISIGLNGVLSHDGLQSALTSSDAGSLASKQDYLQTVQLLSERLHQEGVSESIQARICPALDSLQEQLSSVVSQQQIVNDDDPPNRSNAESPALNSPESANSDMQNGRDNLAQIRDLRAQLQQRAEAVSDNKPDLSKPEPGEPVISVDEYYDDQEENKQAIRFGKG